MQTMRFRAQRKLAKMCVLPMLAIPLASCATMTASSAPTDPARVACQSFAPIAWSGKDTTLTVAQVKEHNAAGRALCGWGGK